MKAKEPRGRAAGWAEAQRVATQQKRDAAKMEAIQRSVDSTDWSLGWGSDVIQSSGTISSDSFINAKTWYTPSTTTNTPIFQGHAQGSDPRANDSQEVPPAEAAPPTYSLDGWFQDKRITVNDIEMDESPISAVIDTVFGLDGNLEEEVTAVSIRDKDGNTRVVTWEELKSRA